MKSAITRTFFCIGLLSCLLPSELTAQPPGDRSPGNLAAVLETSTADSFTGDIPIIEPSRGPLTAEGRISPASYADGGGTACCSCGEPLLSAGCGCACGESVTRQYLTGDMGGARPWLVEQGIIADLQSTQFYQGVSSGGAKQAFRFGGKNDYMFTFLGGKLGLNEGFTAMMHAETRFGEDSNADAGAFAFPNANMLYPAPGTHETAITQLMFMQALNERIALTAGKFNGTDLFNMLYPNTGRGIDGFMNLSFLFPVTLSRTTNLSFNAAGALVMQGKKIQGAVLVYDTNNSSTTVGLNDIFDQGAVVLGYWRFFTEFGGLPGSQGFLANYSNRTYASTDPLSYTVIPGEGLVVGQETGSWTAVYFLDQMLWVDPCNEKRNIRLFSILSLADGNPNLYRWGGNVSIEANGPIRRRAADKMGVGYFYDGLSSDFKRLVGRLPTVDLQDVQGVELYYNAAITPWFHLTADLQVIETSNTANDTAVIFGLRSNFRF